MTATPLLPDDLDASFVPRFRAPVAAVPVAQEAVLYEEDTGDLHRLDEIGAIVCSLFDAQTSIAAAVDELQEAFGAPRETIETDVLALVRDLAGKGLLEGVDASGDDANGTTPAAADAANTTTAADTPEVADDGC